jgi:hypothetical protein
MNTYRKLAAVACLLCLAYAATPEAKQVDASVVKTTAPTAASTEALNPAAVDSLLCKCGAECICGQGPACKCEPAQNFVAAAVPPAPVSSPAQAPALPAGHYELRSQRVGLRNWQNVWVWIPNQAQQPVRFQSSGGCANGRCGR